MSESSLMLIIKLEINVKPYEIKSNILKEFAPNNQTKIKVKIEFI